LPASEPLLAANVRKLREERNQQCGIRRSEDAGLGNRVQGE